jgi:hypothetical protein
LRPRDRFVESDGLDYAPKVVAKFETNLYREWRLEGIARAKAAGVYKGRPAD